MKLKLDLHPIFADGARIEAALGGVIDEACAKRADEVEIIPGKGSGALKKTVLRYLDRPEVKARYHRLEKDSDNWGRLFVHFRWERGQAASPRAPARTAVPVPADCFCCGQPLGIAADRDDLAPSATATLHDCPACGSPNSVTLWLDRGERVRARVAPGYGE